MADEDDSSESSTERDVKLAIGSRFPKIEIRIGGLCNDL
jgi:hypothetical protein